MWPFTSSKKDTSPSTREDRSKCWEARDKYFACLDRVGVLKPGDEKKDGACASEDKAYEQNCAKSWIEYFNQRRVIADAQKDRLAQANTQAANSKR
ncbi:cytochrome oxidase c subunit VIb-domain-containing protein [Lentinula edodes]|uniref:Cytochrome oxidase c subunit VIb-domain-containing protein n=1 Tax=Lentinula lateritia TaxID=40482 RepID=A0A9W9A5A3_9AGAR|nr:cytochrome oxidase c subunit VIb-domain-containing protein [Lentinula edodes]KAH7871289.1 cytochrome oxidase c subunit VIb-domain-containing protein [Lentinula edodes]KAJ3889139.1 cytochrome oxidase c subunit VIb-domain-containing protein [Lentinula edodes]KAJ4473963.1 cytochrome oxidase c subunit VIb-domain-containing protein [Lentinula edodes]